MTIFVIFLFACIVYSAYVTYIKEMRCYKVEFSVEVYDFEGNIDTLNFIDSLWLSSPKTRIIHSPRISKNILSLEYKTKRGYKDTLLAEYVFKYRLFDISGEHYLDFPEATLISNCPE